MADWEYHVTATRQRGVYAISAAPAYHVGKCGNLWEVWNKHTGYPIVSRCHKAKTRKAAIAEYWRWYRQ